MRQCVYMHIFITNDIYYKWIFIKNYIHVEIRWKLQYASVIFRSKLFYLREIFYTYTHDIVQYCTICYVHFSQNFRTSDENQRFLILKNAVCNNAEQYHIFRYLANSISRAIHIFQISSWIVRLAFVLRFNLHAQILGRGITLGERKK